MNGHASDSTDKSPAEWKDEGNAAYKRSSYREAIQAYTQAIIGAPDDASCYGNRAAAYMMTLAYDSAIRDCDKAIELKPDFVKAYWRKGKAFASLGRFKEAKATYNAGLVYDPNNNQGMSEKEEVVRAGNDVERVKALIQKGGQYAFAQANAKIDFLLKFASSCLDFKLLKMDCLLGLSKYEEAFSYSNDLLRSNASPHLLYCRAQCLFYMSNFESAAKHLQQAIRSDPDNNVYTSLLKRVRLLDSKKKEGDEAFQKGHYQNAIDAWTDCLAVDPSHKAFNSKLYSNRATAYAKLRRHPQAISDSSEAVRLDPQYLKAYRRRAESYYAMGGKENLEAAERDFEKCMELTSDNDRREQRELQQRIQQTKVAIKRAKRKDYYQILGLAQDATEEEIRKSYKKLALKHHPDRHTNSAEAEKQEAEKLFRDVAEAYEVLSDKEKRQKYDSGVDLEDMEGCCGGGPGAAAGIDPRIILEMFMRQQGGGMGGGMPFGGIGGMPFGGSAGAGGPNVRFHFG